MAKSIKQLLNPTAETLKNFSRFGKNNQTALVDALIASGKPVQDPPVNPFDIYDFEYELIFTGAGWIIRIKKRRPKMPMPKKRGIAEIRKEVAQFLSEGYTVKTSSTATLRTVELTSKTDANSRLILMTPNLK